LGGNMHLGIDAGGTLIKMAYGPPEGPIGYRSVPIVRLDEAVRWVNERFADAALCLTGGRANLFRERLGRDAGDLVEFEATVSGVKRLLAESGETETSFLLTNVGTGTSIHYIDGGGHYRVGGTGVGGGTMIGLSAMTTGVVDYGELVRRASEGSRDLIDLTVSHIYEGATPPIPGELTASNFGRWLATGGSRRTEDVLASIVGLVGETVATVSVHAAGQCGVKRVFYIGSSFLQNELLRRVVAGYTELRGAKAGFVPHGEYSGALGAWMSTAGK